MSISALIVLIVGGLPASRLKNRMLCWLGWSVGDHAHIGPGIYLNVNSVVIGANSRIGPFNVIRDVAALVIGDFAKVGQWNWLSASLPIRAAGGSGSLVLGSHSSITSRHYLDCSGGIAIGAYTTIAGMRSTLITHGISWRAGTQTFASIVIGDYCLISSNAQFTPGVEITSKVVVGMGATISGALREPGLYVQPRASLVKANLDGQYFERELGSITKILPKLER